VELATKYLPEVIILDLSMPDLTGIQIVEQLRAHPRTKNIPILINTGAVLHGIPERAQPATSFCARRSPLMNPTYRMRAIW